MTQIERFREAVESLDMDCHEIGVAAQEVGPLLLALVDAVEECGPYGCGDPIYIDGEEWERVEDALAKLKEDE